MTKEARHTYPVSKHEVPHVKDFIEEQLRQWQIDDKVAQDVVLAADEAASNIVQHAYADDKNATNKVFALTLKLKNNSLEVILEDEGKAFDIDQAPKPDIKLNLSGKRRGGFGLYLMNALMDGIKYTSKHGKNFMCMKKKLS